MPRSMRVAIAVLAVTSLLSLAAAPAEAGDDRPRGSESALADKHVPDEILVRFARGVPLAAKAAAHARLGAHSVRSYASVDGLHLVKLPKTISVKEAIKLYQQRPDVLYAEPNYIVHTLVTPNDPGFGLLWGLENSGQTGGTPDADIDAASAWGLTTGSASVVVAVIDTGIDYTHPDLANNMFRNTADCDANGVDDDGNGVVDDCYGINTYNNTADPMDDNGHGSHVSGTIGAAGSNGVGVVGVNWDVQLMACKFLGAGGSGSTDGAVACLNYVALMKDRGVNIIATNNSWGGDAFSQSLYDAIDALRQRGILFIAAAGNAGADNNTGLFYPASYYLPNVIAVAATTETDGLASFSNYGKQTAHLGAPGTNIVSTTPGDTYATLSGTSMATPHVTGVAALLKAQDPSRDWRAIRNLILAGGDDRASLTDTITGKRLNAYGALACSGATVLSRLRPIGDAVTGAVGNPVDLTALNINCASPNGPVAVTVASGSQTVATVTLQDGGVAPDLAAADGIYSGQWTPATPGVYSLTFPGGDTVTLSVLSGYTAAPAGYSYRTITGTSLDLGDDSSALVTPPFPIRFGGGNFTSVSINSNGNLSFTGPFTEYANTGIPTPGAATLVAALWDDLYPIPGSAQNVYWAVTGAAPNRELVVEWRNVRTFTCNADSTATVKFQVVLFESSSAVLMNYADAAFGGGCLFADNGGSATVGIQVAGNQGSQFSLNTQSVSGGTALLWTLIAPPSAPAISVSPGSQDFGTVTVGSSADRSFTVQNTGGGTLSGSAAAAAPYAVISGGAFSLGPGASQQVTVRFTPTASGSAPGNVTFTSNAGNLSRPVTGTGAAPTGRITVTVPKAGETWRVTQKKIVKWTSSGVSGAVRIDLSRNRGASWEMLFASVANDGAQEWKVTGPASSGAQIRVCDQTLTVCGTSKGTFTIK